MRICMRMRGATSPVVRSLGAMAAVALVVGVSACGSSSSSSSSAAPASTATSTTSTTSSTSTSTSGRINEVDPKRGAHLGKCGVTLESCTVYKNADLGALKGKTVGVMVYIDVPGIDRWSVPTLKFLKEAGAHVEYSNLNGNVSLAPGVLNNWVTQKVSAILEIGVPLGGYHSFLDAVQAQKIPVVVYGAGNWQIPGVVSIDTDHFVTGELNANYVVSHFPKGGTVLSINNPANAALVARGAGQQAVFKQHPQFKFVTQGVPTFSVESGYQVATAFLQGHPDTVAIIGATGELGVGSWQAAERAHSKAIVLGFDGDLTELKAMGEPNSLYKMTTANALEAGGTLSVETAAVMLSGQPPASENMMMDSVAIDQSNLPTPGTTDQSARNVWQLVPSN